MVFFSLINTHFYPPCGVDGLLSLRWKFISTNMRHVQTTVKSNLEHLLEFSLHRQHLILPDFLNICTLHYYITPMDGKLSNEEWPCCLHLECTGDICEYCFYKRYQKYLSLNKDNLILNFWSIFTAAIAGIQWNNSIPSKTKGYWNWSF